MDTKKLKPIFAPLLEDRQFDIIFALVPLLLIILDFVDIFHWKCPFRAIFSLDCPGCGMTRAVLMLLEGDISTAFSLHPFVFLCIPAWLLLAICALLPNEKRKVFARILFQIEEKTSIIYLLFVFFIIYGFARLILQIYA